jgi:hypothetical protein
MIAEGNPAEMIFRVVGLEVLTTVMFSGMCCDMAGGPKGLEESAVSGVGV